MTAIVDAPLALHPQPLAQARAIAWRSLLTSRRQIAFVIFPSLFPLVFAALSVSSFEDATALPGFPPVDSFLDFILPATITQAVMFGGMGVGSGLALDIQDGFFDRLLASPVSRISILVGRLAGASVVAVGQATAFIALYYIFGGRIDAGFAGFVVLLVYSVFVALAVGGLMSGIAIRTGSTEVVQGSFPLLFVILYPSSAFFPVTLQTGWFQTVAEYNPITWMIDGARDLVIVGWSWSATAQCLGVSGALTLIGFLYAHRSLRQRLAAR
jgi:ABC-2 type transport system permease protein